MKRQKIRFSGELRIHDSRGYCYIPKILRKEVGVEGKDQIPFLIDANCVLLIRKGSEIEQILKGLDILREDLKLRCVNTQDKPKGTCQRRGLQEESEAIIKSRARSRIEGSKERGHLNSI